VFLIAAVGAVGARAAQGASAKTDPVAATSSAEAFKAPAPNSNAACLECHSDQQLTMKKAGHVVPLFFDQGRFTRSVHKNLDCTDCHEGFDGESMPHKKAITAVDCGSCHEKQAKLYATSIHG